MACSTGIFLFVDLIFHLVINVVILVWLDELQL
jgi:hypothetical protein